MKRFSHTGYVCLAAALLIGLSIVGCTPPAEEADPSTTTAPIWTPPEVEVDLGTPPDESIDEPEEPTAEVEEPEPSPEEPAEAVAIVGDMKLVPLALELPDPAFRGTPKPQDEPNVEKPLGKPRPPFLAPEGTANLAIAQPVACSDPAPAAGEIDQLTDGEKEASDFGYLELRTGSQWVQVDLGQKATIFAVLLWHNHAEARVYRDVIVQVSDDPDFLEATTVFNNDYDNSSGMGVGPDMGYVETSEGKLIDCRGVEGRYIRCYSKGSHLDEKNHYTEIEVFGKPTI